MMTFDPSHQPTTLEIGVIAAIVAAILCWYGWYFWDTIQEMNKLLEKAGTRHDDLD